MAANLVAAGLALLASFATADSARISAPADSVRPRAVRRFPEHLVPGERRVDRGSIQTVRAITPDQVRALPVDGFAQLVATRAGVVAVAGDLHVRGGRSGELAVELAGLPLADALEGRAPTLPLGAIESANLLLGGLDAEHAGALAGALELHTRAPGRERWTGGASWSSDGRRGTGFDAVRARADGPLPGTPFALAVAADASLDDLGLPALRSQGRRELLGARFGWRADNRLLAWARISPRAAPRLASLQVFASRRIEQPYDPMFRFDGWVHLCPDSQACYDPFTRTYYPDDSTRYRGADHVVMTETRELAAIASMTKTLVDGWWRVSLGTLHRRTLASVGLRGDDGYVRAGNRATFGAFDSPYSDPFLAYSGDEPYFRRGLSTRWLAATDAAHQWSPDARSQFGLGAATDDVEEYEKDDAEPRIPGLDLVRRFRARAPGGWAYAQHRWESGGLVLNLGMRAQWFSAGPQAAPRQRDVVTWSPRLGFSYPMSDRDAFSLSYVRLHQEPARRYLYESRVTAWPRRPLGNPDLKPAEVISYQAALEHRFDETRSAQVAVFYRDAYGLVGVRDSTSGVPVSRPRYQDDDVAHAGGAELTLSWAQGGARAELAYTYLEAWGLQSREDGLETRPALGRFTQPVGEHPLDWDQRHTFALTASGRVRPWLEASWITRVGSPRPWTPVKGMVEAFEDGLPQPFYPILLNSARLGWSENTDVALRARTRWLPRATWTLEARNLFDSRHEVRASWNGYPNRWVNTAYDEYGAYRTLTGNGGGAYWDAPSGDGRYRWVPVDDPRLRATPRSVRLGVEVGF